MELGKHPETKEPASVSTCTVTFSSLSVITSFFPLFKDWMSALDSKGRDYFEAPIVLKHYLICCLAHTVCT